MEFARYYDTHYNNACIAGIIAGTCGGLAHIYVRRAGIDRLNIVHSMTQCGSFAVVLSVAHHAQYHMQRLYSDVRYYYGSPQLAAAVLVLPVIKYCIGSYILTLLMGSWLSRARVYKLFRAGKTFISTIATFISNLFGCDCDQCRQTINN